MTELNYWQKRALRRQRVCPTGARASATDLRLHRWHENYNRQMGKCPACGQYRTVRFVSDTWESDTMHKRRLQCGYCGYVWQHNLDRDDALLYRSTDASKPSSRRYRPLPYQRHRQDTYHPVR